MLLGVEPALGIVDDRMWSSRHLDPNGGAVPTMAVRTPVTSNDDRREPRDTGPSTAVDRGPNGSNIGWTWTPRA